MDDDAGIAYRSMTASSIINRRCVFRIPLRQVGKTAGGSDCFRKSNFDFSAKNEGFMADGKCCAIAGCVPLIRKFIAYLSLIKKGFSNLEINIRVEVGINWRQ